MAEARVVRPDRRQLRWDMIDLEGLLPAEHRARIVWSFVESLDLSQLYDQVLSQVLAREGEAGRPAADPAVLLSLWLYATVEGVGSARELERLAQSDAAYRWLAGGVPLNYHGLADFRVGQAEILDRLLTQSVTALIAEGLISLAEIAVDGTKVRASASKESFRTGEKLIKIEAAVAERLAALKQELASDPGASSRRGQAARDLAARRLEDRNPMRRSQTSSPFSLSPPEPPSPQGERQGLEVEETPSGPPPNTKNAIPSHARKRGSRRRPQGFSLTPTYKAPWRWIPASGHDRK